MHNPLLPSSSSLPPTGYLYEAGVGWASLPHPGGWRWMVAAVVVPPALLVLALLCVVESPFWLVTRGRHEEVGGRLH